MFGIMQSIFLIMILITFLEKLKIINPISIPDPLAIGILIIMFIVGHIYFISNRKRRNRIIDNYRELKKFNKNLWTIISVSMLVIPLVLIFIS